MPSDEQDILIARLYSPKDRIEARPNEDLAHRLPDLLRVFASGGSVDPIEVVPHRDGYYILSGVRRAVAARSAGLSTIRAVVLSETVVGKVLGRSFPLAEVPFPILGRH